MVVANERKLGTPLVLIIHTDTFFGSLTKHFQISKIFQTVSSLNKIFTLSSNFLSESLFIVKDASESRVIHTSVYFNYISIELGVPNPIDSFLFELRSERLMNHKC